MVARVPCGVVAECLRGLTTAQPAGNCNGADTRDCCPTYGSTASLSRIRPCQYRTGQAFLGTVANALIGAPRGRSVEETLGQHCQCKPPSRKYLAVIATEISGGKAPGKRVDEGKVRTGEASTPGPTFRPGRNARSECESGAFPGAHFSRSAGAPIPFHIFSGPPRLLPCTIPLLDDDECAHDALEIYPDTNDGPETTRLQHKLKESALPAPKKIAKQPFRSHLP
ncbi:hypothetical protein IWZ01DRAFT_485857 [Phyllosticta capitalensis]